MNMVYDKGILMVFFFLNIIDGRDNNNGQVSKTDIGRIDSDLGMVVSHSFCIWYGLYYGAYH